MKRRHYSQARARPTGSIASPSDRLADELVWVLIAKDRSRAPAVVVV